MFKREFKINFKSLILWTSITMALFLLVFCIYPSIASENNMSMLNEMLEMFPSELIKAFNMDIAGLSSAFGWFKGEGLVFLLLIGGFYSAILGGTILVKEENDKTIEYLYSKPINRNQIITSKILCGVINILIFTTAVTLFNLVGFKLSGEIDYKLFFLLSLTPLVIFYTIFFLSLLISTFFTKTKKSMSIAIAFVFLSYFLQIIGNMSDKVKYIKYASAFELAPSRNIMLENSIDLCRLGIAFLIIIVSIFLIYKIYNKKELV